MTIGFSRLGWILLALTTLLVWPGVAAAATWTRAETKHFIFYSSGKPSELETFAVEAEKFDAMLRTRFNIPEDEIVNRLTIYVLPTAKEVSKLKGVPNGTLGGFYQSSIEGSYAVSNRDRPQNKYEGSGQQILFHEYTHHFFARHMTSAYPVWLREGIAEYYSTTTFAKDGTYSVGGLVWGRSYGLVLGERLPIRTVLFGDLDKLDRRQSDIFYGRSWLLVHKLMSDPEGLQTLSTYMADLNQGMAPEQAAVKSFGDLDVLDKEVEKLEKTALTMFKFKLPISFDAAYEAAQLDEAQSQIMQLQLQRRASNDKNAALTGLRALTEAYPDNIAALNELAHAEYYAALGNEDEAAEATGFAQAEAATDKVLALEPNHVRANVMKGKLLLDRKGPDATDADFIAARKFLAKANRADPQDPLPLYEYFRTFTGQGKQPPQIAFDGLEQSFLRAKENTDFRVTLAYALANDGRFNEASSLVRFLVNDPHAGEFGQHILAELEEMKQSRADFDARKAAYESGNSGEATADDESF